MFQYITPSVSENQMNMTCNKSIKKDSRISWAVMPQFDINLPGNWKTLAGLFSTALRHNF